MAKETATNSNDSVKKGGENGKEKSSNNSKIIIIVLGAVIVVLAVVIAVWAVINNKQKLVEEGKEAIARDAVVTEDNVDAIVAAKDENVRTPGVYTAKMNSNWTFVDGATACTDIYVENVEANTTSVIFDIILSDTNETIYESPIIPVGEKITSITLNRDLEPGVYKAICSYHFVDENNVLLDGETNFTVTITVLN